MPNTIALISSLYDKWFLKNQNFRGSSIKWVKKNIKMEWNLCSSASWVPFFPYTMFQYPMSKTSCQTSRKAFITQNVLGTQSSNIVHCHWHTQKPISADFQAFLNTFSLLKLMFFLFFVRGVKQTAKNFTFC